MQQEKGIQNKLDAAKTSGLELAHRPATIAHVRKAKSEFVTLLQRAYRSFFFVAGTVASSGLTKCNDIDECLGDHGCPGHSQCVNKVKTKGSEDAKLEP